MVQLSVADLPDAASPASLPITGEQGALIVFTSGTTGKPKAVVHTVESVSAMVTSLIEAWGWLDTDVIPLFLPLHHVHGIVNILLCALWRGATVDLLHALMQSASARRLLPGGTRFSWPYPPSTSNYCLFENTRGGGAESD